MTPLTPEQIASLTDEQATEMVAEALGWKREKMHLGVHGWAKHWIDANGRIVAPLDYSPPTDIKDAWPLFERLSDASHGTLGWTIKKYFGEWKVTEPKCSDMSEKSFEHDCVERAITNAYIWAWSNGMLADRKDGEK